MPGGVLHFYLALFSMKCKFKKKKKRKPSWIWCLPICPVTKADTLYSCHYLLWLLFPGGISWHTTFVSKGSLVEGKCTTTVVRSKAEASGPGRQKGVEGSPEGMAKRRGNKSGSLEELLSY